MQTVIVTIMAIMGMSICSANSHCDNNDTNGGMSICCANSHCDNNDTTRKNYMQY